MIASFEYYSNPGEDIKSGLLQSGHGGSHVQVDSWLCVYDLDSREPLLNLRAR